MTSFAPALRWCASWEGMTRGLAALVGVAALACAWPTSAQANPAIIHDTVGDAVRVDSRTATYRQPDIINGSVTYSAAGFPASPNDVVTGRMLIDASADPDIQLQLLRDRTYDRMLVWRIDVDDDLTTGDQNRTFGRGADVIITASLTSDDSVRAVIRTWDRSRGSFQPAPSPVPASIPVHADGNGFYWTVPAAWLGVIRGQTARVLLEAVSDRWASRWDRAPDDRVGVPFTPPLFAAPYASVEAPSYLTTSSAVIPVNVNGWGQPADWYISYGLQGQPQTTTNTSATDGAAARVAAVTLNSLLPSSVYTYQVVVTNPWGETRSPVATFTTPAVPAGPPSATVNTQGVTTVTTGILTRGANLRASLTPSGRVNEWWFEWGATTALGRRTPTRRVSRRATPLEVRFPLRGLLPGTNYFYRLVTRIDGNRVDGGMHRFRTRPVSRLMLTGRLRVACGGGVCRITPRSNLSVRLRQPNGRVIRGRTVARKTRVVARCVSKCKGRRVLRTRVARGDLRVPIDPVVRRWAMRRGAVVEIRVSRPGITGSIYRLTSRGRTAAGRICALRVNNTVRC